MASCAVLKVMLAHLCGRLLGRDFTKIVLAEQEGATATGDKAASLMEAPGHFASWFLLSLQVFGLARAVCAMVFLFVGPDEGGCHCWHLLFACHLVFAFPELLLGGYHSCQPAVPSS